MYPFCFLTFLDLFSKIKLTIMFSAILSLCRFGDHVLLFSGSTAIRCWCFRPPILRFLRFFFSPHRPTQNQETYSTLNEQKGDDLSLMVSFCFCFVLFCFVFFGRRNKLKLTLFKDPLFFLWRFSSAYKKSEKREDLLTATAMGWG